MARVKPTIFQVDWSGGTNLLAAPNRIGQSQARLVQGADVRTGYPLRHLIGKTLFSPIEVGAAVYDNFANEVIDPVKWRETDSGSNVSVESTSTGPRLTLTGSSAFDANGVVSKSNLVTIRTASFIQLDITTPSATTGQLRIGIQSGNTTLATGNGLELWFDGSANIQRREAGSATDTTYNYEASKKYRIKFIREADLGWKCYISSLSDTTFDNQLLFDTTYNGNTPGYLAINCHSLTWKVQNIITHEGYEAGAKGPIMGAVRWYRYGEDPITVVATDDGLLDWDGTSWTWVKRGFTVGKRWSFLVHREELYAVNGEGYLQRREGSTWTNLTSAPIGLEHIESHLDRIWASRGNEVYLSDFINPENWDIVDDSFDMEQWKGDRVTGLIRLGSVMLIAKDNSFWQVVGTLRDSFVLRKVPGVKGCPYPWTISSDGAVAYYMGVDGFYRTDGTSTFQHLSPQLAPLFRHGTSETGAIRLGTSDGPCGVFHDFKYRVSVEMSTQDTNGYNNVEWIYDTLASDAGAWTSRVNRHLNCYLAYDGHDDTNILLAGNSNSDGGFYLIDNDNQEVRSQFAPVDAADSQSVNISTKLVTRRFFGGDPLSMKTWHNFRLHYFENGAVTSTVKWLTSRRTVPGTFSTITHTGTNVMTTAGLLMDGTEYFADSFARTKNNPVQLTSGKQDGEEVWFEITNAGTSGWGIMGFECDFEDYAQR